MRVIVPLIIIALASGACVDALGDACEAGDAYADACPVVESDRMACPAGEVSLACEVGATAHRAHVNRQGCDVIYAGCSDDDLERMRRFSTCIARGAICNEADYVACEDRLDGLAEACAEGIRSL